MHLKMKDSVKSINEISMINACTDPYAQINETEITRILMENKAFIDAIALMLVSLCSLTALSLLLPFACCIKTNSLK